MFNLMSLHSQDYGHLYPRDAPYSRRCNANDSAPEHHDACSRTCNLSPVTELSMDYAMEREHGRSLTYSDCDRYTPAYMHEHGYPSHADHDNRGYGFPPQQSGGYYNNPQAFRRGYDRDSRWGDQGARSPYHHNHDANSITQLGEQSSNAPPSA